MKNRSIMQHAFSRTPQVRMPRSVFNRSHGYKTTFDADWLIPFYVDEVIPGDTFNLKATVLLRLNSPAIKPFMDNLWCDTFFFFVPLRLLWTNFKKFMGEQLSPADSISFNVPQITGPNVAAGGIPIGHLFDYMGLPVGPLSGGGAVSGITFDNFHGRAYNQIWDNWFRDENMQNGVAEDVGNGPDTWTDYSLLKRGKRYDYFTSALPWAQKGGVAVSLPLGTDAPVIPDGTQLTKWDTATDAGWSIQGVTGTINLQKSGANFGATQSAWISTSGLKANLSGATAATIYELRQAIASQQFLERDARGGTRYPELIVSHFGVTNPDARVQRPELLSTSSERVIVTPVAQTAPKSNVGTLTDQGNLSGFGTSAGRCGFQKSFTEHGVLIGLVSVRADITYQQGMDRMWSRRTRYDFFWPTFATLGEQAIKNREIYCDLADGTGAAQKDGVFGYTPIYEEYRFKNSKITGNLRSYNGHSANANTLDVWHLSEAFSSQPTLGSTFIQSAVPLDRVISVPAQDHFIMDAYFDLKCARVMPMFGIPGLSKL